ncbi:hypothetical protein QF034_000106 [Streptomyces africanus]|uniref:Ricin B lectin domain-containing protein n=1 Tax=Streptomyces africanus TaxID=231024 RepID=A0ABU0QFF7_9ACTN|nr:hypothetical protein [Streptomyces africanus]MDQ0745875.1 hypothetical protein [Streptomyces africanus]
MPTSNQEVEYPAPIPVPDGHVMVVHAVTNSYWMPDRVNDEDTNDRDELQNFTADPLWDNAAVLWRFTRLRNGAYRISSTHDRKHVTRVGEAARNTPIRLYPKEDGSPSQHWDLVPIPGLADTPGQAPVRAVVARGTSYAIGMVDNVLSLDAEMRLIRMWNNQPTIYHGWTLIPVPSAEQEAE